MAQSVLANLIAKKGVVAPSERKDSYAEIIRKPMRIVDILGDSDNVIRQGTRTGQILKTQLLRVSMPDAPEWGEWSESIVDNNIHAEVNIGDVVECKLGIRSEKDAQALAEKYSANRVTDKQTGKVIPAPSDYVDILAIGSPKTLKRIGTAVSGDPTALFLAALRSGHNA